MIFRYLDTNGNGTGDNFMVVRWTFERSGFGLRLQDQQKFKLVLNDDFSVLTSHFFQVQGFKRS
jgi:hypothetical protein